MKAEENQEQPRQIQPRRIYGSLAKAATVAVQLICTAILVICVGIFALYLFNGGDPNNLKGQSRYVDTKKCADEVWTQMHQNAYGIKDAKLLNAQGIYDAQQKVDIVNLSAGETQGSDVKGNPAVSYTVQQLKDMGALGTADTLRNNLSYDFGSYNGVSGEQGYYYSILSKDYLEDLGAIITADEAEAYVNGTTSLKNTEAADYVTEEELETAKRIEELSGRKITEFSDRFIYLFTVGSKEEEGIGVTAAGTTLAEYAAKNSTTVSLEELYAELASAIYYIQSFQSVEEITSVQNTNIRYYMTDSDGQIYTNIQEWKTKKNAVNSDMEELKTYASSIYYQRKNGSITEMAVGSNTKATTEMKSLFAANEMLGADETVFIGVDGSFPAEDQISQAAAVYERYSPCVIPAIVIAIISCILLLLAFVLSNFQSGHRKEDTKIYLFGFDRMPTEVFFGLMICGILVEAVAAITALKIVLYASTETELWGLVLVAALSVLCLGGLMIFYYSLVRRIKGKNLWKNSLLHSIIGVCQNVYAARKTSSKMIVVFCAFVFMHMFLITAFSGFGVLLCMIADGIVMLYMLREAAGRQTIIEGIRMIGSGNLDYKVDTTNLNGDNLVLADTLNTVGDGLNAAIQERLKSERLKADLITNVSHDIKTPLTSIINYVDLLQRENIQDEKIQGYLKVLENKSQRLKQLTEDLVEASKVSSGNVKLEFAVLNLNELIQQINGEFDERFHNRNLNLICSLESENLRIAVDGRQIWRVLENLYGNAAKYSMPGTRIYVDTRREAGRIYFSIKNISENPLNINADELTERFIRGDVSRSTEGSGLGLSIAQNLTRLQHGEFDIQLDGDLFKVTVSFAEVLKGNE